MKTIALGISVGVITLLSACSSQSADKNTETPINVSVYSPQTSQQTGIRVSGQITSKQTATISTRMMGYVQKIHVKPGDRVNAGQLLISINGNDLKAKKQQALAMVTEAQAAEQNAKRDYERFTTLRQQNSVSEKEFENVELQYTSMKSKLKMAQEALNEINVHLSYSDITAPFTGTVTRKMIDEGSMANPGMPLLVVEQAGDLVVQASIPESDIQNVKVGDKADIEVKSIGESFSGTVIELSPSAYGTGGQYLMKVSPEKGKEKGIRSGMFANLTIKKDKKGELTDQRLMVENSSLVNRDQLTGVYVVDKQNQAVLKWIRVGKESNGRTEVLSGLNPDDKIIKQADGKLYNGKKVTLSK
ncbi:efflux RND transporter periplasmic adaptor subunit [Massilibacteroides sp.]|uniref:efflux RND transporter periplasmic adaptor subunit n=1 Tax=Massilibacteroides sp. TaxID=2034766 RepID=UPI0026203165|nr:efflux RND transporter periplasmic adaptor subunit [Massilibacteroides sp.]MDD4516139.1 efflux RND transporter periplasmic adaptor subunit [Massilibacteroides sp.]